MKDGKMVQIAYHLFESSIGAYIEWLVNELMWLLIKIEYKDTRLVMLSANAINPQARYPYISLESLSFLLSGKSC